MLDLRYSLVIEATNDPTFFGFYSPDLEGFTGVGHSVEDCLYQARWGMEEHLTLLRGRGLPVPMASKDPHVVIRNAQPDKAAAASAKRASRATAPRRLVGSRLARRPTSAGGASRRAATSMEESPAPRRGHGKP